MAHKSEQKLRDALVAAASNIPLQAVYAHYKNRDKTYTVIDHVIMEANDEVGVVYKANYGGGITFVRALSSWQTKVEFDGKTVPRFSRIS